MSETRPSTPLRVIFWGTYDLSKPRTRILRDGLREMGVDIVEIHADVWSRHTDKSQLSKLTMLLTLFRLLFSYPGLIFRYCRAPDHDVVVIPYLGQFDVLVLWVFARLKGKPIVWDMFLSLYDTVVNDRKMTSRWSPPALALKGVEWLGCRAATRVVLDTHAHANYITTLFGLPAGHTGAVPVGIEPNAFARLTGPKPHDGPTRVLFYGQLIPLHGVETILCAALSERGQQHVWHIIGKGQQGKLVDEMLASSDAPHIEREDWVPYSKLTDAIAQADICLGIFGSSQKAASVVPNKVYQCLAAGRTVITRQSPAMAETFPTKQPGLRFVSHSDPDALLDAIDNASGDGFPVVPEDMLSCAQPKEIGRVLYDDVLAELSNKNRM